MHTPPGANDAQDTIVEGDISVLAALQAGVRQVRHVMIDQAKPRDELTELDATLRATKTRVSRVARAEIDALAFGATHGGVIAQAGPRRFLDLPDLATGAEPGAWFAMLDGIEDPFNFGQSVRALYAAGCAGLVLRPRTWKGGDSVILRSSAGATEFMPTALAGDPADAIAHFRDRGGYTIAVTARDRRAQSIYDIGLSSSMFLLIGGEKRGLRRELLDTADVVLRIPYKRKFPHSLGSAGSTAVLAFELMRQRLVRP
jgi:23S rRNA (guanosine2251-2'-O)-methyltransferase